MYGAIFSVDYLYTDEAAELWHFKNGFNYGTYVGQGRYLMYKVFETTFSSIHTVHAVVYARTVSLLGWIVCLPVWYYIMSVLVVKNGFSKMLVLCSMIYLVSMPTVAISIGWTSCMELFIAYTTGLVSGYILWSGITCEGERIRVSFISLALSVLFGVISLFTYQNGFGCFLIPFLLPFISLKKVTRNTYIGIGIYLFIYVVYYLLFKYSIKALGLELNSRTSFAVNPVDKLLFFFKHTMPGAFRFTWLFNEKSIVGVIVSFLIASAWIIAGFARQKDKNLREKLAYFFFLVPFLVLIYLPSIIVRENYSSNRTTLALYMAVFLLVTETVFSFIRQQKTAYMVTGAIALLLLGSGWYNFNKQFIDPVAAEYSSVKKIVLDRYNAGARDIYVIRPGEDAFKKKYGIVPSWDEFGVPSTAKSWTPEPLIRQIIFEKTGNRQKAESIPIKSWADQETFKASGEAVGQGTLLIDLEKMIAGQ